jgi:hypothetical protein
MNDAVVSALRDPPPFVPVSGGRVLGWVWVAGESCLLERFAALHTLPPIVGGRPLSSWDLCRCALAYCDRVGFAGFGFAFFDELATRLGCVAR